VHLRVLYVDEAYDTALVYLCMEPCDNARRASVVVYRRAPTTPLSADVIMQLGAAVGQNCVSSERFQYIPHTGTLALPGPMMRMIIKKIIQYILIV
jgi:hypothetical protein